MNLLKKIVCFCFLGVFSGSIGQAQCPEDDIHLATQADVNEFVILYPNCTEFTENLCVGKLLGQSGSSDITDLSPLSQITFIEGDLELHQNENLPNLVGLNNLTSVGRSFTISASHTITNLNALGNLTSVGRGLYIRNNWNLINLNGLENLTSIGTSLGLSGNFKLIDISTLENITSLEGGLSISNNFDLPNLNGLHNITLIDDNLLIYSNDDLPDLSGLEGLTSIGGGVTIENNENLMNLSGLDNLISIDGRFYLMENGSLTDLSALSNLTSIGGQLIIDDNDDLISLTGLENLASIGELGISYNSNLVDLGAFYNLTSIAGNLYIGYNADLVNLSGLDNLTLVEGRLSIINNSGLITLSGLDNLTFIGDDISIEDNDNLRNLSGLQNTTFDVMENIYIRNNPILSVCSVPFICSHIENGGFASVQNNASDCNSKPEILTVCSFPSKIVTNVFYDINQNKIQDTNEPNYYDASILIESASNFHYAQNGIFYVEPGSYTAIFDEANNPNWQLTTDVTSYSLNLEEDETETITFGIYPTQQISHIQTIINSAPARCNERIILNATTKNLGTTIASGTMWLTIDEAIPDFTFIHQPDTIIESVDTYYGWNFMDLYPGQTIIKNVEVTVPGPPDFELGNQLLFVSFSEFTDANGEDTSQGFRYNPEVRCSFDPNDKLINPNREGDYVLFEEDLIYTVRFQNTGNDVAYDVVIRDTLDTNLDLSTFRFLGSSHANRLNTILNEDEGILTFEFRDIFLPDSTSNFEASQGYVNYLIETIDGLAEETPVTNSAGIYFDLNPPVITNTTQSIMVSELPTVSVENPDNSFNFNILPNPNNGTFTIQDIPTGTYQILNTSGQIIRGGDMQNDLSIDISQEAQGMYFISVTIDNETFVRRIVKM